MAAQSLVGRAHELHEIDQLLGRASKDGGALLIRGEAGVGKSAILAEAVARADASAMRVLHTTGVQSETNLPFAGLHQLLQSSLDGIDALAGPQRSAIRAALGMADEGPPDIFLVGLATLNLLADLAESLPVLIVADDAQWLDGPSADVLTFVARRLGADPIALIVAIREGVRSPVAQAGLPELPLLPLDDRSAAALLDVRAPNLPAPVRARLLAESVGNPLALVELPNALSVEHLQGESTLPAVLPLTQRLEQTFAARVASMPTETQHVLLVAAIDERSVLAEIVAAADAADGASSAEALEPAIDAHLIEVVEDSLRFRHPLVRSAIYQAATLSDRRSAHAGLAAILEGEPDRYAWHLGASVIGLDANVAQELNEAATRAQQRGAPAVAVAAMERAAALTRDPNLRAARLLASAELAFELGQPAVVDRLVTEAQDLDLGPRDRGRVAWLREIFDDGVPGDADAVHRLVDSAVAAIDADDHDLALNLLHAAALRCWWADSGDEARGLVLAAAKRIGADGSDARVLEIMGLAAPIDSGRAVSRGAAVAVSAPPDPDATRIFGMAAHAVGDFGAAMRLLSLATPALRSQGRIGLLAQALVVRAWDGIHLGRFGEATRDADEGGRLATESEQPIWIAGALIARGLLAGVRGDGDLAEALALEADAMLLSRRLGDLMAVNQLARGLTALTVGRHADAFDHLRRLFDDRDTAFNQLESLAAVGYVTEAAVHADRHHDARGIVAAMESLARRTPAPLLHVGLRYARAALAEDGGAEERYRAALAEDPDWPFDRARLQLAFGAWLRRQRRVAESRPYLGAARDAFDALGVTPWGERARQELRASGITSRRRTVEAWDQLSPQEHQIAEMAAEGLSNREIGERLYLSHRTVASHLYRIFPKLGITSRGQLQRALTDESLITA